MISTLYLDLFFLVYVYLFFVSNDLHFFEVLHSLFAHSFKGSDLLLSGVASLTQLSYFLTAQMSFLNC